MIHGIKVSHEPRSFQDLEETGVRFCEVWYNAGKPELYEELFAYLTAKGIKAGLHYWGVVEGSVNTNLSYPDNKILTASKKLIFRTMETAARINAAYVNIHPGSRALVSVDFSDFAFRVIRKPIALDLADAIFSETVTELRDFGEHLGVRLILETVPSRVARIHQPDARLSRKDAINIYEMPIASIYKAAVAGIRIANDFGHTAATSPSAEPGSVRSHLAEMTKSLAPMTDLIHIGYVIPPFNGVDYHGNFDDPEFTDLGTAIPDNRLMKKLLGNFAGRSDIYILAEPEKNHPEVYRRVRKLLAETDIRSSG